ncbi:hypothetical protein ABPG72_021522 [Tetrahymena utriculariae]
MLSISRDQRNNANIKKCKASMPTQILKRQPFIIVFTQYKKSQAKNFQRNKFLSGEPRSKNPAYHSGKFLKIFQVMIFQHPAGYQGRKVLISQLFALFSKYITLLKRILTKQQIQISQMCPIERFKFVQLNNTRKRIDLEHHHIQDQIDQNQMIKIKCYNNQVFYQRKPALYINPAHLSGLFLKELS